MCYIMWSSLSGTCVATSRWFSPCTPVSTTNNADHPGITEILLKVALNTTITVIDSVYWHCAYLCIIHIFSVSVCGYYLLADWVTCTCLIRCLQYHSLFVLKTNIWMKIHISWQPIKWLIKKTFNIDQINLL